ncbi:ABC transporter permease [Leptospira sp. 96542]|nr:ABC transporter permease [Leptospira sp. 96542]
MIAIQLEQLSKFYKIGKERFQVLKNISLTIHEGEFVAIMGASGSGKSTLLQILGLLDDADTGSYHLFGVNTRNQTNDFLADLRGTTIGFIFQQFHLLQKTNALNNVLLPTLYSLVNEPIQTAKQLLEKVGLASRLEHAPNELSGGQQQRVAIARSLMNDPKIIFADEPTGNLDSKSKIDIMSELIRLHEEGRTIVMVTHEPEMAKYCERIIQFSDGEIISDKKQKPIKPKHLDTKLSVRKKRIEIILGIFKQSVISLLANRLRSFLSALGILFGVACVICVMALGEGAKKNIEDQFSSMGANLLIVRTGGMRSGGVSLEAGSVNRLDLFDLEAIKRKFPFIQNITATVNARGQVVYANKNWNSYIMGVSPSYEQLRNLQPAEGRFFSETEVNHKSLVCLVGATVLRELYDNKQAVGTYIKINRIQFKVIGVLPEKGSAGFRDQDDVILVPITTAMRRLMNKDSVDGLEMEVSESEDRESFISELKSLLHGRHGTNESMGNIYQILSMADIQAAVSETSETMSSLLIALAVISLVVGGIGIMNIMLVSVKERTKEIGLRKALGARESDIRMQFLIESSLTSLSGGIAGVFFGILIVYFLQVYFGWTIVLSFPSIGIAFLFSISIGILFGWWPSEYASKLSPIIALRSE